jgi:hypothetical protein
MLRARVELGIKYTEMGGGKKEAKLAFNKGMDER